MLILTLTTFCKAWYTVFRILHLKLINYNGSTSSTDWYCQFLKSNTVISRYNHDSLVLMVVAIMQFGLINHLDISFSNNDMHVLSYRNIWERPKTKIVKFAYLRCMIELTWNFCIITIRSRILSTNTNKEGNKQLRLLVHFRWEIIQLNIWLGSCKEP